MYLAPYLTILTLGASAIAHPGAHKEHNRDTLARREFLASAKRSIAACKDQIFSRGFEDEAIERRANIAKKLREQLGLPQRTHINKRDFDSVLATDHHSNRTDLASGSSGADVFTGDMACVLQPEVTAGPYWVKGEFVRSNIREKELGIPLYTDYQIIDTSTCKGLSDVYVDIWHANATGVYSGVVAQNNGDYNDKANINTTFNRGIAQTDRHGVAFFKTIFPGHYARRATHLHVLANVDATRLKNGTITGGRISHVGQVFFDQSLINTVEKTSPYSDNKQTLTQNSDDDIISRSMDPVVQYVWLGSRPEDGLLAWITIGIDPDESYTPHAAATWTDDGGVENDEPTSDSLLDL